MYMPCKDEFHSSRVDLVKNLFKRCFILCLLFLITMAVAASAQEKRPLKIEDYAQWKSISGQSISDNGLWLAYSVKPQYGNGELVVRDMQTGNENRVPRGINPVFAHNDSLCIFLVSSPVDNDNKEDKKIKSKLGIMTLGTETVEETDRVENFKVSENGGWLAYKMHGPDKDEEKQEKDNQKKPEKKTGTDVVLTNLDSGEEIIFKEVSEYFFDENSRYFLYAVASDNESGNGVYARDLSSGSSITLLSGSGKYEHFTWDEDADNLAFASGADNQDTKKTTWKIYRWHAGDSKAVLAVEPGRTRDFPKDLTIAANPSLEWSRNSRSLFFDICEIPEPPDTSIKEEDLPGVDIWHWKDVLIQTQQKNRIKQLENKSFKTVYHIDYNRVVRLADEQIRTVSIAPNSMLGVGGDVREYEYNQPWNPTWQDVYLVDVNDGTRTLVRKKQRGRVRWSDSGKFLYWFEDQDWFVYSIATAEVINLTEQIPVELRNILDDHPNILPPWGTAGWTEDDEGMLIYDQFDIWFAPVDGDPENMTGGEGRRRNVTFRYVSIDPEEKFIDIDEPVLLKMLDNRTKAQGFYRLRNGTRNPVRLYEAPKKLGNPVKADNADVFLFTQESFTEFPDLHTSTHDFKNIRKVSDANPQQDQFLWGTEQLIEWHSTDGKPLQGVLYLPENYEQGKKYPLILYIYEIMSNRMHSYSPPIANHRFNATEYTSNGYAVLYPDVVYDRGIPGPSSVKCLVPAVQKVVDMGIADPERVGIQGHSWGGYEAAYLVTQTNIFAAVCSGAPVSNMTSAYGGIRWSSGNPRTFQYETGQSRIGGYQAIEYFLALRRLNKPVWFLQYNGEPHHLQKKKNKYDWTVRMFEFFEHYLKDKPMPEWMEKGVSVTQKGRK